MTARDLFVRTPPTKKGRAVAAGEDAAATPVFITPQTLTSFVGASFVINLVTRVIHGVVPAAPLTITTAIVAFLVGSGVFLINVTDPRSKPGSRREWAIASAVGLLNSFYLIAVALGMGVVGPSEIGGGGS